MAKEQDKEWRIKRGMNPQKAEERIWCCMQYMNADSYPSKETMAAILGLEYVDIPEETEEVVNSGDDTNCIQE